MASSFVTGPFEMRSLVTKPIKQCLINWANKSFLVHVGERQIVRGTGKLNTSNCLFSIDWEGLALNGAKRHLMIVNNSKVS